MPKRNLRISWTFPEKLGILKERWGLLRDMWEDNGYLGIIGVFMENDAFWKSENLEAYLRLYWGFSRNFGVFGDISDY